MTTIEDLAPDRFELVARWLSRPDVNRWLTSEWRDREVQAATIAMAVRNKRNRLFLVVHDGVPCGLVALAEIDVVDRTAMVWYVLGEPGLAGRGITSAAVGLVARKAFGELELQSLYAWIIDGNAASERVLANAGFRPAGRIRGATRSAGIQVDRVLYDLVAADLHAGGRTSVG